MFGRRRGKLNPPRVKPAPEVAEAITQLRRLGEQKSELEQPAQLYAELLPVLFNRIGSLPSSDPAIAPAVASQKLAHGIPLLRELPLELDWKSLTDRWQQMCSILEQHRHPEQPHRLAKAVACGHLDPGAALRGVFQHGAEQYESELAAQDLDAALGVTVLRLCALPLLAPLASRLGSHWIRSGWSRGYCPLCGCWALLAELRGMEQTRWLRCGLCAAAWPVDRGVCPFCELRDHRRLQQFYVEGEGEKYRIAACDGCRSFLKCLATLTPRPAPGLLVAEVETLHLEYVATARGYAAPDSAPRQPEGLYNPDVPSTSECG